jgi:indole-3-glycerol phosphate synthase
MNKNNYLNEIVLQKNKEVNQLLITFEKDSQHPLHDILIKQKQPSGLFAAALRCKELAVIAEIKRKSPSKGDLSDISDPVSLALQYCQGGASAISVLTDEVNFGGSLDDLQKISEALHSQFSHVPILRKDFIIHPIQLAESVYAGASSVLLIACYLKNKLTDFIKEANRLGLETLVEIHDEADLECAIQANAPIIGINHRNLASFEMNMSLSEKLRHKIPQQYIVVAESGIHTAEMAHLMYQRGCDAILVGEALVRAQSPGELITQMRGGGENES